MKLKAIDQGARILKNSLSGVFASVLGGALQFGTILLIIRTLSVEDWGAFSLLMSIALIIQYVSDFGLSNILVKEFSSDLPREIELRGKAQGLILSINFVLIVLLLLVLFILKYLLNWSINLPMAVVMSLTGIFFFQCAGFTAVIRAHEDMEWNAYGHIIHKIVLFLAILIVSATQAGIWGVILAHLMAVLTLYLFYRLTVHYKYSKAPVLFDFSYYKYLLRQSIPLGSGLAVRQISWQVDLFVLAALTSEYLVGLFSGPYRIFAAVLIIAQVLSIPVFPLMSRLAATKDYVNLSHIYTSTLKLLLFIGSCACAFGYTFAHVVTAMLGEGYSDTTSSFQWLSFAFPALFAGSIFAFIFTAINRQSQFLIFSIIALCLRVGIAYSLVPHFGFIGSCIAILASEYIAILCWTIAIGRNGLPFKAWVGVGMPSIALILMLYCFKLTHAADSLIGASIGIPMALLAFGIIFALSIYVTPNERIFFQEKLAQFKGRRWPQPAT
ncbi:MAG: O-antigen/teichoic acid export membrane protein [Lentimonas sp.]|jgi:O-antigen/teichoic acid export membrane protein